MRSSLPPGKSATPPARCIHSPQRYTSSAEYHLLVSRASCGASRELSSRRSPALIPHTCAVSPTFRYGAFLFVASALADLSSARLASCDRGHAPIRRKHRHYPTLSPQAEDSTANLTHKPSPTRKQAFYNCSAGTVPDIFSNSSCASRYPCSAAFQSHLTASVLSAATPSPFK